MYTYVNDEGMEVSEIVERLFREKPTIYLKGCVVETVYHVVGGLEALLLLCNL